MQEPKGRFLSDGPVRCRGVIGLGVGEPLVCGGGVPAQAGNGNEKREKQQRSWVVVVCWPKNVCLFVWADLPRHEGGAWALLALGRRDE